MTNFDNFSAKGSLGSWQHASRLYVDGNMRLAPKVKFLYHVVLNINPQANIPALNNNNILEINLLAKTVDLPRYRTQVQSVHQYNRKKLIQTGVEYQPINIEFHDDNAGLTSLLWESYFRYYYADSTYSSSNGVGSPDTTAAPYTKIEQSKNRVYGNSSQNSFAYGLDRPNKVQFFDSIQIFQLHPQNGEYTFTSFTLVNPIIEVFEHDTMDQTASEFVLNRMTIGYEAVQYGRNILKEGSSPTGFADIHYDKQPSGYGTGSLSNAAVKGSQASDFERIAPSNQATQQQFQNQSSAPITQRSTEVESQNGVIFPKSSTQTEVTEAVPKTFNV
jgi:hypothetical protein